MPRVDRSTLAVIWPSNLQHHSATKAQRHEGFFCLYKFGYPKRFPKLSAHQTGEFLRFFLSDFVSLWQQRKIIDENINYDTT